VLVSTDVCVNMLIGSFFGGSIDISNWRILRLFRLLRALLILKIFAELRLMIAAFLGAMSALFWGFLFLGIAIVMFAIVAVQLIHPLNVEISELGIHDNCSRCPHAFESIYEASLTFTHEIVAGGGWGHLTMSIIDHHPPAFAFFLLVVIIVGYACTNLILAVVVNIATEERERMVQKVRKEKSDGIFRARMKLLELFKGLDKDGSGDLEKHELLAGFTENHDFEECLLKMGVNEEDLHVVWSLADEDKSGTVSYEEFVNHVFQMTQSDTRFMLVYIKHFLSDVRRTITQDMGNLVARSEAMYAKQMDSTLAKIEDDLEESMEAVGKSVGMTSFKRHVNAAMLTPKLCEGEHVKAAPNPAGASDATTGSSLTDQAILDGVIVGESAAQSSDSGLSGARFDKNGKVRNVLAGTRQEWERPLGPFDSSEYDNPGIVATDEIPQPMPPLFGACIGPVPSLSARPFYEPVDGSPPPSSRCAKANANTIA